MDIRNKMMIQFKSEPIFFDKEKSGTKNNTVRKLDTDSRFELLQKRSKNKYIDLWIKIINSKTEKYFMRRVQDISYFENFVIITWVT